MFPAAGAFVAQPLQTLALVFLGCVGYVAVGTVFAAGLATGSGKNVLLTIILYPLTTPVLLYALVATRALLEQHPGSGTYIAQLAALDAILVVVAMFVFEHVLVPGAARPAASPRRARG
jgi:heme exporter protein B